MISGATVLYLSASDWDGPWHGPQEIARRLGAAGNRVVYVETLAWRRLRPHDLPRAAGRLARAARGRLRPGRRRPGGDVAPGVELVSPVLVPGARSAAGRALNRALLARALGARLRPADRPRILWIYTPSRLALDMVGALEEDLALYHCTQSHRHRPTSPPGTAQVERALIERVGAVVTDGIELYRERVGLHPHVYRIPSGVDPGAHAAARPAPWAAGLRRPVIGYLGSVDHRIDPLLLHALARARPDATLVVVGPVTDVSVEGLRALPNVVMHGQVPIDEVPAALAAFDVGVLPYAARPMTRYTYPAKLHQYLAAGLRIASVPLPDLAEFADLVETGEGAAGLAAAVERALAAPADAEARRAVAARNTWDDRMRDLSLVLEGHLEGRPPASVEGSPRGVARDQAAG